MHNNSCFRRSEKLRKSNEIVSVLKRGKKLTTPYFLLYISPADLPWSRIGVSVPRKTGNAVIRNRIKRLIREYFRLYKECCTFPVDIFIVALPASIRMSYHSGLKEYLSALRRYFQKYQK